MKWLTALLAVSTLAFAGTTWHFVHLLRLERGRNAQLAMPVPPPPPGLKSVVDPEPEPTAATGPQQAGKDKNTDQTTDPGQLAVKRRRLDELHDPVARAECGKAIASLLREDWVQIAPQLGLSLPELDRVIADMSERLLKNMERQLQCELDPACDPAAFRKSTGMTQDEVTAAALGPDRYARFRAFQDSYRERNIVYALNLQLPAASAVNGATKDQLVQAFATQRKQFVQNAEELGEKAESDGAVYSSAVAGAADEYTRRRQTAAEYVRRQLEIADGILNPQQLAALKDRLERDLYHFTDRMKNAEVAAAARAPASRD